jgi:hypothetical protein
MTDKCAISKASSEIPSSLSFYIHGIVKAKKSGLAMLGHLIPDLVRLVIALEAPSKGLPVTPIGLSLYLRFEFLSLS